MVDGFGVGDPSKHKSINLVVSSLALNPAVAETDIFPQCVNHSPKRQHSNWPLHLISVPLPHIAAQVPCLPSSSIQRLSAWRLTLRWCRQDAACHCRSTAYPSPDWHVWQTPSPVNSSYQLGCYHQIWSVWNLQQRILGRGSYSCCFH